MDLNHQHCFQIAIKRDNNTEVRMSSKNVAELCI